VVLVQEPVLKGPKYNGTPFVVTTNRCKFGFAGMVSQWHMTVLPNGMERSTMHPITFYWKRTAKMEQKYKLFLLEFAALKYTLYKASDMIWGYEVELERDCQVLHDHLLDVTVHFSQFFSIHFSVVIVVVHSLLHCSVLCASYFVVWFFVTF